MMWYLFHEHKSIKEQEKSNKTDTEDSDCGILLCGGVDESVNVQWTHPKRKRWYTFSLESTHLLVNHPIDETCHYYCTTMSCYFLSQRALHDEQPQIKMPFEYWGTLFTINPFIFLPNISCASCPLLHVIMSILHLPSFTLLLFPNIISGTWLIFQPNSIGTHP